MLLKIILIVAAMEIAATVFKFFAPMLRIKIIIWLATGGTVWPTKEEGKELLKAEDEDRLKEEVMEIIKKHWGGKFL
jgi:hypothetical protein